MMDTRKHGIIDADSLIYAAGFAAQKTRHIACTSEGFIAKELDNKKDALAYIEAHPDLELDTYVDAAPLGIAIHNLNRMVEGIIEGAGIDTWTLYITDSSKCWRSAYATIQKYKGNRDGMVRPVHYHELRDYLVGKWKAFTVQYIEADDAVVMEYQECYRDGIMIHIDKDLDQASGLHYNPNKDEFYWLEPYEADRLFYTQLLTGDKIDNIKGLSEKRPLRGIGPKTAESILNGCETSKEMFFAVHEKYVEKYGTEYTYESWDGKGYTRNAMEMLDENAQLLYLARHDGDKWEVPC
jgi:hypothetical protein